MGGLGLIGSVDVVLWGVLSEGVLVLLISIPHSRASWLWRMVGGVLFTVALSAWSCIFGVLRVCLLLFIVLCLRLYNRP